MATIDELSIEVQSSAKKVDNSIGKVAQQLEKLAVATSKVSASKLNSISVGFKNISRATVGIKKENASAISSLSRALNSLGKIQSDGIQNAASSMKILSDGMKDISDISVDTDAIKGTIDALGKIGKIKASDNSEGISGAVKSLKELSKISDIKIPKIDVDLENFDALGKAIGKISKIKAIQNMGDVSNAIESLKGLEKISDIKIPEVDVKGIDSAARSVKNLVEISKGLKSVQKLKGINLDINTENFDAVADSIKKKFQDSGMNFEPPDGFKETEKVAKSLEKHLDSLIQKENEMRVSLEFGGGIDGNKFIKLQGDIAGTSNKLNILNSQIEKVKKSSSQLSKSFTIQRGENTASGIDVDKPQKRMVSTQSLGYDPGAMEAVFGESAKEIKNFNDAVKKLGNGAGSVLNGIENDFVEIGESAKKTKESVSGVGDKLEKSFKVAEMSVDEFEDYLENLEIPEIRIDSLKKLQAELKQTEKKLDELASKSDNWAKKGVDPNSTQFRNLQEQIVATSKKSDALKKKIKEVGETKPNVSGWQKLTAVATLIDKSFSAIKRGVSSALSSIKKLGNGFKSLYSVVKKVSSAIGKMFSNIAQLAGKATSAITSSVKGMTNAFSKLRGESSGIQTATSGLGKLAKTAAGLVATGGLISFGKQATELGSDITEVENVVDTAFGSMAGKVYNFASDAAENFGLSELAAKQYSGTMMAMLKSSQVPKEAAADMSVTLAGLAGDFASFYNIDTDTAFQKLRAGISGETEPLKQLGINMNIVNLEAYAMSQGINKAYREMSLQEQTLLRYNYILAKTGDAQGDFASTAGTWANQLRLLRLNLQSISAIIGQGLIAALLPAIKLLNKFMAKLTQAAKKFRDFMYVLFGKKIESPTRGIADDMAGMADYTPDLSGVSEPAEDIADESEDVSDGMDDAADSMDNATDSAKKLKKALSVLGFDELHQLNKDLDDLDTSKISVGKGKDKNKDLGLDDIGLDDLGLGNLDDAFDDLYDKTEIEPINEWARKIREAFLNHDWEGLGKVIAELVNAGLKKLYDFIREITPKVESAMRALAKVINSFVKWLDWDLLGRTIGAGINLLARAFNALFGPGGIDLEQLGRKLSVGLRGMIDEVDWRNLGNAIGNYFMIAWRIASGFVEDMWRINPDTLLTGWAEVGIALAEMVYGIFERINFKQIGDTIALGFNGIVEIIRNFRNQMAADGTWSMIAMGISDGINSIIDKIDLSGAAQQISGLVLDILYMLNDAAERTHWSEFGYKVAEAIFSIPWLTLFNQVFDLVSATFGEAMKGFVNYLTTHAVQLGNSFADVFNTIFAKIKYIASNIPWDDIGIAISTFLNTAIAKIRPGQAAVSLGNFVTSLLGTMLQVAQETHWDDLGRKIGIFLQMIPWSTILGQVFDTVTTVFSGLITGLGGKVLNMLPSVGTALAEGFNHAFNTLKTFVDSMDGRWTEIGHTIATSLNNMISGIDWKAAGQTFGRFIKGVIDTIFTVAMETDWAGFGRSIGEFLDGIPWLEILGKVAATIGKVIVQVIDGLKETTSGQVILFLGKVWLGIKGFQLGNKVLEVVNEFAKNFGLLPQGVDSVVPLLRKAISKITGGGEGGIFGKIISTAKDVVSKVGQKLGFLPKSVTDTIPGISRGVETIAGGTGLFSKILGGASGLVSKIGPILGSIGSVIFSPQGLMIAGIVAGVAVIIANWDSVKKAAGEIWGAVKTAVTDTWEGIKTAAGDIWDGVKTVLFDVWEGIKTYAGDVWEGTKVVISDSWDALTTVAHDTWDALSTYLKDTWDGLKTIASDVWGGITTGISDVWGGLKTVAGDVWGAITGKVSDENSNTESNTSASWSTMQENLNGSLQAMNEAVTSTMETIKTTVSVSMAEITAAYISGWQTISGASSGVLNQVQAEVNTLMQSLKGVITISMQEISAIFTSGWQLASAASVVAIEQISANVAVRMTAMQVVVSTSMQQIAGIFSNAWQSIGNMSFSATERMLQDVTGKMSRMLQTVTSSMTAIGNAYSSGWRAAGSATSVSLNDISNTVTSKMNSVKNTINSTMNSIQNTFKTKWNAIGNVANQALNKMQSTVTTKMNAMKSTVNTSMASIQNTFKTKWNEIENAVAQALNKIQSAVTAKMNSIKNTISNSMNSIQSTFKTKWNEIENTITQTLNHIHATITSKMNAMKSTVNTEMTAIYNTFKTKWDSASNTCTQALNKIQSIVSSKMVSIKNTVANAMSSIISTYQNAMNRMPNITRNALTSVVNEFNRLPNRIGSSLNNNMLTAGKNAAISFANGIKSIHIPTPHIRVASWTQHKAGDSTYSTPNFGVNWYAKGGLAYNPSVVGIGEAGPEAILPLENKRTMSMIADSITENQSGRIDENAIANAVAEGVAMALMSNMGNLASSDQQPIYITVKTESDEVLARAVTRGQKSLDYRMNPTPQMAY